MIEAQEPERSEAMHVPEEALHTFRYMSSSLIFTAHNIASLIMLGEYGGYLPRRHYILQRASLFSTNARTGAVSTLVDRLLTSRLISPSRPVKLVCSTPGGCAVGRMSCSHGEHAKSYIKSMAPSTSDPVSRYQVPVLVGHILLVRK